MSAIPLLSSKGSAALPQKHAREPSDAIDPVVLRPLNEPQDNLFAAHRSHSSHSSHRSSSGGGYSPPASKPTPTPREPSESPSDRSFTSPESSRPTDPGRAAPVSPKPKPATPPPLTLAEKRTLQIMRVQIALTSLGLYTGPVDGELGEQTKEALKRYQIVKGIEPDGLMSTETLNALGVPAAQ
jgi:His-Xaa-Ser repeat protein HxsA